MLGINEFPKLRALRAYMPLGLKLLRAYMP